MPNRVQGQSTVEWLGATVAVAVLALTLIASAPGLAGAVGGGVARVVCVVGATVTGEACPEVAAVEASTQTQTRPIIEATGAGGLRADPLAGGSAAKALDARALDRPDRTPPQRDDEAGGGVVLNGGLGRSVLLRRNRQGLPLPAG